MPVLRFRNSQADELEARAKAQAEVRQREFERMQAGTDLLPPPGAELLGSWFVTEESIISRVGHTLASVEFEVFDFETITPDGMVTGTTYAQGKNIFQGRLRGGKTPTGTKQMDIKGRLSGPNVVRFVQVPAFPPAYFMLNVLNGPHVCEGEWNDYRMSGYMFCALTGCYLDFQAVKLDELHDEIE